MDKVKSKKEKRKDHFATLMDICHLKNAELEPKHQKYTGRLVFRGDMVKDDSAAHAVFTEQGSSASQTTAAKEMLLRDYQDALDKSPTQYQLTPR